MGVRVEKIGPGRPKKEIKKIHTPRIVVFETTIEMIRAIAEETGRSQSAIYQEALDMWIERYRKQKRMVAL